MLKFRRCDKIITQRLPSAHSGGGGKASIFLCPDYPHEGANLQPCWICRFCGYFNSRPREGANLIQPGRGSRLLAISIPAPVRGRTCAGPRRAAGCPPISIPAPVRGRTRGRAGPTAGQPISIPAPARGRTSHGDIGNGSGGNFNSRPREGANRRCESRPGLLSDFNSRPREGANRGRGLESDSRECDFNSRPREGANPARRMICPSKAVFQFPPPRGGEPWTLCTRAQASNFNSRPREGANIINDFLHHVCVFQFPPPRGGEPRMGHEIQHSSSISIPAPARGRTCNYLQHFQNPYFNSRPREGANSQARPVLPGSHNFNSRPREGANLLN